MRDDDKEYLELYGTVHRLVISPSTGSVWSHLITIEPGNNALLTPSDVDKIVEHFRPDGGLTATPAQLDEALARIRLPMMTGDPSRLDIVKRVAKALGVSVPDDYEPEERW